MKKRNPKQRLVLEFRGDCDSINVRTPYSKYYSKNCYVHIFRDFNNQYYYWKSENLLIDSKTNDKVKAGEFVSLKGEVYPEIVEYYNNIPCTKLSGCIQVQGNSMIVNLPVSTYKKFYSHLNIVPNSYNNNGGDGDERIATVDVVFPNEKSESHNIKFILRNRLTNERKTVQAHTEKEAVSKLGKDWEVIDSE